LDFIVPREHRDPARTIEHPARGQRTVTERIEDDPVFVLGTDRIEPTFLGEYPPFKTSLFDVRFHDGIRFEIEGILNVASALNTLYRLRQAFREPPEVRQIRQHTLSDSAERRQIKIFHTRFSERVNDSPSISTVSE
jgi:hypothetical protein